MLRGTINIFCKVHDVTNLFGSHNEVKKRIR